MVVIKMKIELYRKSAVDEINIEKGFLDSIRTTSKLNS